MNIKDFIPILAPILGFIPVFLKWLNDRSTEAANRKLIEQSKAQVEFWQVWLQAQREVSDDKRLAQLKNEVAQQLDYLMQKNMEIETKKQEKETVNESHSFLQKIFLVYVPHTASGWIFHTLYYITVSLTFLLLWGSSIKGTDINDQVSSWVQMKNEVGNNISMFIFLIIAVIIFQRLARRSEVKLLKKMKAKENQSI